MIRRSSVDAGAEAPHSVAARLPSAGPAPRWLGCSERAVWLLPRLACLLLVIFAFSASNLGLVELLARKTVRCSAFAFPDDVLSLNT